MEMSKPLGKSPDKAEKIIVKQIIDPSTFWISEFPKADEMPGRMSVEEIEKCLEETKRHKALYPTVDQLVAVRETDTRKWQRGKIKNIIKTTTNKLYEILLIDCGKSIHEESSAVYELPQLLKGEQPHAFQLVLHGIVPLSMDLEMINNIAEEWSAAVVCLTKEMIKLDSYGFIIPKSCNDKEKIVYGDLHLCIGNHTSLNWGDFLVQKGYGIRNEIVFRERCGLPSASTTRKWNLGEEKQSIPKVANCGVEWLSPKERKRLPSSDNERKISKKYDRRRIYHSESLSSDSTESSMGRSSKSPVRTFFPAGLNMAEADKIYKNMHCNKAFSGDEFKSTVKGKTKSTLTGKSTSQRNNTQSILSLGSRFTRSCKSDSSKNSISVKEPAGHKFQQKHEKHAMSEETITSLAEFWNKRFAIRSSESEASDATVERRNKPVSSSSSSGSACSLVAKEKARGSNFNVPPIEPNVRDTVFSKLPKSSFSPKESNISSTLACSSTLLPVDDTLGFDTEIPQASSTPVLLNSQVTESLCDSVQSDILTKDLSLVHDHPNKLPMGSDIKIHETEIAGNSVSSGRTRRSSKGKLGSVTFEPVNISDLPAQDMVTLTEQMQSVPVLVHNAEGKLEPYTNIDDVKFLREIHNALREYINRMMRIQKYSWRAILEERNLVMISPHKSGKTLAYVAPLTSLLLKRKKCDMIPKGNGPVILILCSGSSNVLAIKRVCENLLKGCDIDVIGAYGGGADDAELECHLVNGCHILITTPRCLIRLLLRGMFVLNLNRLRFFVLDEADILTLRFFPEIEHICKHMNKELNKRTKDTAHLQVVAAAQKWCPGVEKMTKSLYKPVICIAAYQEAIVYSHIKPQVHIVKEDSRLTVTVDIFKTRNFLQKKTVVVCQRVQEVTDVAKALQELNICVVLVAHEEMMSFDLHNIFVKWGWEKTPTLVCTDTFLQEMSIQDAEQLIHYSLPEDSRTQFSFRFSCLFKNTPSCVPDLKAVEESSHHPVVHILIGDNDYKQLPFLIRFLKRVGVSVDSDTQSRSTKAAIDKELSKDRVPLCFNFKAFGDCWKRSVCEFRHIVSEKDKPQNIPRAGTVKLKIIHTHDACNYSARLLEHTDESGKTEPIHNLLMTLTRSLHDYFKQKENRVVWPDPKVYDICALETSRDVFERVQVQSTSRRDQHGNPREVVVRLIDDGCQKNVKPLKLMTLPQELRLLPPQVVEVYLCRLCPCDLDWSWGNAAGTKVNKVIGDADRTGRYMIGKIKLSLGCTIWVDPLECRQHLPTLKTNTLVFSLRRKLLEMNLAVENPQHLEMLFKACEAGGLELPEQKKEKRFSEEEKPEIKVDVQWAFLPMDDFSAVSFIVGENPGSFFVRQTKFETCLNQLSKKLCKTAEESTTTERNFFVGDYCIGKFPDDGDWYRARVEATEENILSLFYVDHGDRATVPQCDVRPIPDNLLTDLPFQAIECSLAVVKPNNGKWSEEATDMLYEITAEETGPFVKVLYAKVCQKIGSGLYGSNKYNVILIDKNEKETSVLNQVMVDRGVACMVEDQRHLLEDTDTSQIEAQTDHDNNDDDDNGDDSNIQVQQVSGTDVELEKVNELPESSMTDSVASNTCANESLQTSNLSSEVKDALLLNESGANSTSDTFNMSVQEQKSSIFNWEEMDDEDFQYFRSFVQERLLAERRAVEKAERKKQLENIPDKYRHVNSDDDDESESSSVSVNASSNEARSSSYKETSSSDHMSLMPPLESRTRHPEIIWRQDYYNVWLNISLAGVKDYYLSWHVLDLEFWTLFHGIEYFFHLKLFGAIHPEKLTHSGGGLCIQIKLHKLHVGAMWPRLLEEESRQPWLKRDLNAMDEEEEIENLSEKFLHELPRRCKSVKKPARGNESSLVIPVDTSDEEGSGSDIVEPNDEQYDPYDPLN